MMNFVMERLSSAREMRERQKERYDSVEIKESKNEEGTTVWVVECKNN